MNTNFTSPDFYHIDDLLSEEHKLIRESTRQWVSKSVCPIIEDYAQKAEFPKHLIKELGEIGAFGPYIPQKYGGAGLDQISYGIMMQEIERGDSGIRSTSSVQSSLVMYPIWKFGSEEQKQKFLPKLSTGEMMGCFGLTEPDHGSNPSGMITNFKSDGDDVILNGSKMWISNSPFADIAIVWAKDENKRIHGIIVERGMEGFTTPETHNKWSLRASATGGTADREFSIVVKAPVQTVFTADGTWTVPTGLTAARILVVAGGGAVGRNSTGFDDRRRNESRHGRSDVPRAGALRYGAPGHRIHP